ncbi:hypothetical protein T627_01445, partial [Mycobacterium tuberculosis UT0124]
ERGGIYPESDKTGYIHLSTLEQVHLPANRLYQVLRSVASGRQPGTPANRRLTVVGESPRG